MPAGESILVEGGPPGEELYVVRLGTFELVHKDAYVAVVTAGEIIGHPTLLTGLAPEFTVRAREDSLLYCIPRDEAVGLLGRSRRASSGSPTFFREPCCRRPAPSTRCPTCAPSRSHRVARSKPLLCDPETTARKKPRDHHRREALGDTWCAAPGGHGIQGIVTDIDLHNQVIMGRVTPRPRTEIMSSPVTPMGEGVLTGKAHAHSP